MSTDIKAGFLFIYFFLKITTRSHTRGKRYRALSGIESASVFVNRCFLCGSYFSFYYNGDCVEKIFWLPAVASSCRPSPAMYLHSLQCRDGFDHCWVANNVRVGSQLNPVPSRLESLRIQLVRRQRGACWWNPMMTLFAVPPVAGTMGA